jgi:hypothetical protein
MTEVLPKMVLKQQLLDTFAEAQALGPLFVVCHDYSQDIKCAGSPAARWRTKQSSQVSAAARDPAHGDHRHAPGDDARRR